MKKIKYLILLFSISLSYGQDSDLYTYELDSIASIDFPFEEISEIDTIVNGVRLYQIYATNKNSNLIAQKVEFEEKGIDENLSQLPYDKASLLKTYKETVKGFSESLSSYKIVSEGEFIKDSLTGYRVHFRNKSKKKVYSFQLYLINKHLYNLIYKNEVNFNDEERDRFFNSLKFDNTDKLNQFGGKSLAYRQGYAIVPIIFGGLIIMGFVLGIYWYKKK